MINNLTLTDLFAHEKLSYSPVRSCVYKFDVIFLFPSTLLHHVATTRVKLLQIWTRELLFIPPNHWYSHSKCKSYICSRYDLMMGYIKNYWTIRDNCYILLRVFIWGCYDLAHAKNIINFTRIVKNACH